MSSTSIRQMVCGSRAESQILLYSARRRLLAAEKDRLLRILASPLDWDYLCRLATAHGTLPLLFRSLRDLPGSAVPGLHLRNIGRHFVSNAVRSRKHTEVLLRILDLFEDRGILAVPYKGPVLAASAYGDSTLRISGDLDLLLHPRDVRKAVHLLLAKGFRWPEKARGRTDFDIRSGFRVELEGLGQNPPVELHWNFSDDLDSAIDPARWFGQLQSQQISGRRVPVLPTEQVLISLCVHGTKELWNRLLLVADISELVRYHPNLHWTVLLDLARTPDALRILSIALALARDLMEVDLPAEINGVIDQDRDARKLSRRVARRLLTRPSTVVRPPERIPFALAVRRHPRQRAQYVANYLRVLATPDELDFAWARLPRKLSFLYYFLRPFRRALVYLSLICQKLQASRLPGLRFTHR